MIRLNEEEFERFQKAVAIHNVGFDEDNFCGLFIMEYEDEQEMRNWVRSQESSYKGDGILVYDFLDNRYESWNEFFYRYFFERRIPPATHFLNLDNWLAGGDGKRISIWNNMRDKFFDEVPTAVLGWLKPETISRLTIEAPELWAKRTGVYSIFKEEVNSVSIQKGYTKPTP